MQDESESDVVEGADTDADTATPTEAKNDEEGEERDARKDALDQSLLVVDEKIIGNASEVAESSPPARPSSSKEAAVPMNEADCRSKPTAWADMEDESEGEAEAVGVTPALAAPSARYIPPAKRTGAAAALGNAAATSSGEGVQERQLDRWDRRATRLPRREGRKEFRAGGDGQQSRQDRDREVAAPAPSAPPAPLAPPASPAQSAPAPKPSAPPRSWAEAVRPLQAWEPLDEAVQEPISMVLEELRGQGAAAVLEWFQKNEATEWLRTRMRPMGGLEGPELRSEESLLALAAELLAELQGAASSSEEAYCPWPASKSSDGPQRGSGRPGQAWPLAPLSKDDGVAAGQDILRAVKGSQGSWYFGSEARKEKQVEENEEAPVATTVGSPSSSLQGMRAEAPEFIPAPPTLMMPEQMVPVQLVPVQVVCFQNPDGACILSPAGMLPTPQQQDLPPSQEWQPPPPEDGSSTPSPRQLGQDLPAHQLMETLRCKLME